MGREGGKEEETKGKNLKGGGREREEGPAGAKREEEEEEEESHVPTNIASVHLVTGRPNATAVGEKNRPLEQPTTKAAQILPPPPSPITNHHYSGWSGSSGTDIGWAGNGRRKGKGE